MPQTISVGNLLLDLSNFRIVKQDSQKQARDAIISGGFNGHLYAYLSITTVPEPKTVALGGLGLVALFGLFRRNRKN